MPGAASRFFYRALVRQSERAAGAKAGFVVRRIDHGFALNGPHGEFRLCARRLVYDAVRSRDDFQPRLEQVVHSPEEVIDQAWNGIPADGMAGEGDALTQLLERLCEGRARLPS